jgi:putative ABC transport system permease protein
MSSNSFITEHSGNRKSYIFNQVWVSPDFGNTYNLELIEGRFISTDPSDSLAIVINEKGVEMLGFSDPVGKTLILPSVSENVDKHYKIVGVIKDIYYQSLYNEISPMVFTPMPNHWEGYISVYLDRENMRETLKYIYNTWNKYTSKYPFSYFFLEDDLVKLYKSEYSTRKLLNIFSLIASLIAVIGLIGLISFTTNRRTKEIGVRKTFGASIHQIVFLLFRQVIPILFIGVFLAWPVAYLLLNYWMKNFSYAVSNNPGIFVLASFAMLGLSFIVMSFIIYQGARRNPVYALRYE